MLLFAAFGWWSYERVQAEASDQIGRTVDILHEEGLRFFETERYLLQNVDSQLLGLSWPEIIARRSRFDELLDETAAQLPEVEAMFVGDADGTTELSSNDPELTAAAAAALHQTAIEVRDRPYFKEVQAGASFVIAGPLLSRVTDDPVIAIVHRLSAPDNSFRGLVVVNIDVNRLVRSWRAVTTPGNAVALVRDDGTILARYPPLPVPPSLDTRLYRLCGLRSEHPAAVVSNRERVRRHRRRRFGRPAACILGGDPPGARRGHGAAPGGGDGARARPKRGGAARALPQGADGDAFARQQPLHHRCQ